MRDVLISEENQMTKRGFGWIRDLPDHRDYTMATAAVQPLLDKFQNEIKDKVDLSSKFSPVEDQGAIGSCTANAAASLVEYFELTTFGQFIEVSRLFLYYGARYMGGCFPGDNGAAIRNVVGALVIFGAPPEKFWPYDISQVDSVPSGPCFAFGQSFQTVNYYRLDPLGIERPELLNNIKWHLSNRIPVIFGFTGYTSLNRPDTGGDIPYPAQIESVIGGHAVVAAGYDDDKVIINPFDQSTTTGALLIRNSWGLEWGRQGYGWLPYAYVLKGLAVDFWVLLKNEWVDINPFI
jgi:C1A family cysteine protease